MSIVRILLVSACALAPAAAALASEPGEIGLSPTALRPHPGMRSMSAPPADPPGQVKNPNPSGPGRGNARLRVDDEDGGSDYSTYPPARIPPDGVSDRRKTTRYTYDSQGRRLRDDVDVDDGADGTIDHAEWRTFTYDRRGDVLTEQFDFDIDLDGSSEGGELTINTYDSRGNLVHQYFEVRYFFEEPPFVEYTSTFDAVYDERNRILASSLFEDYPNYGFSIGHATAYQEWDRQGRVLRSTEIIDYENDGTEDAITQRQATRDSQGNLLVDSYATHQSGGGVDTQVWRRTWDQHGAMTSFSNVSDYHWHPGDYDYGMAGTIAVDQRGNPLIAVSGVESYSPEGGDFEPDESPEIVFTTTWTY